MKVTYLGTAASEGFPALFCNCSYCNQARALKGKNIRSRSQTLINDDLLIDLPADSYMHAVNNGLRFDKISTLCITHSHSDHLSPNEFLIRGGAFAHDMESEKLHILLGESAHQEIMQVIGDKLGGTIAENLRFEIVKPYREVQSGRYRITPLPARHQPDTDAFIYYVEDGEKSLLYAHDTGYFFEEVFEWLEKKNIVLDMISLDCTNVNIPIADDGLHMGLPNNVRLVERLRTSSVISKQTKIFINHFSHNAMPLQSYLEEQASRHGFSVSYDGLAIEF